MTSNSWDTNCNYRDSRWECGCGNNWWNCGGWHNKGCGCKNGCGNCGNWGCGW